MKNKTVTFIAICWSFFGVATLQAQDAVPASGGNSSGSGGTASFTIGQVAYTTNSAATNGSVAPGVQQAFEISILTGASPGNINNLNCSVFPNPANDFLILKLETYSDDKDALIFQLFGQSGTLIENGKIENNQTRISMASLPSSAYILKVLNGDKEIQSFKIVKK